MLIVDAHLDLSMNALEWNRDLKLTAKDIRKREEGLTDKPDRAKGMVSLPELRKGKVGLVVATMIARYVAPDSTLPGWHSPEQAWAQTQGQRSWYVAMEDVGEMIQITNKKQLNDHIQLWNNGAIPDAEKPVGYILSLEGADSLVNLSYLEKSYRYGLRALGPAHYGPGRYAPGTGMQGPLTAKGVELVKAMDELNMILDVTHLTDEGFKQATDMYKGPVWASHHNCRALVDYQRQLTDEQIKILIERGSVIGGVLDAWMLKPGWIRGKNDPVKDNITLELLIDNYDHICQLAGNCNHIAIGSDLDGMFGQEQSPHDMDTIADLQLLKGLLAKRGYTEEDTRKIFHGNWLRFLERAWG
ncbi:MAG: dipeptidase [Agriterribacter sp.]